MNGSALSISTEAIARAAQFPTVQSMNDIEVIQNITLYPTVTAV